MECRHGCSSNIIVWRMGPGVSCKNARGLDEVLAGGGGVGLVGGEGGRVGGVGAGLGLNLVLVPGDCRTLCLALDLTANLLDESSPDLDKITLMIKISVI